VKTDVDLKWIVLCNLYCMFFVLEIHFLWGVIGDDWSFDGCLYSEDADQSELAALMAIADCSR
jgi:hypothetical protein